MKVKNFWAWLRFSLIPEKCFRKVCKKLDFSPKYYFVVILFKVSAWLSNHAVCKVGLTTLQPLTVPSQAELLCPISNSKSVHISSNLLIRDCFFDEIRNYNLRDSISNYVFFPIIVLWWILNKQLFHFSGFQFLPNTDYVYFVIDFIANRCLNVIFKPNVDNFLYFLY